MVYSEKSHNEKSSSGILADENQLSDRSNKSINDEPFDPLSKIKNLRLRNVNKTIIDNIDINSPLNKFEQLKELVMRNSDVLVITETKFGDLSLLCSF